MKVTYFYCVLTHADDKTEYNSGSATIDDPDLAKLPNQLLDDVCKEYGVSRKQSVLITLNRL